MPFEGPPVVDAEALQLATDMDSVLLDISNQMDALLKRIDAGEKLDRTNMLSIEALFSKIKNLMTRMNLKKGNKLVSEVNIESYSLRTRELTEAYEYIVEAIANQNPASRDPKSMTMDEVVQILSTLVDDGSDFYSEVNQRFLELGKGLPLEEARIRCMRAFQKVLAAGDTGEKDFSVGWAEVTKQLINKTTNFIDIGRYLFTIHDEKIRKETPASEVDKLPINKRAIEMFDYMIDRIKGNKGGIARNPVFPNDGDFSYNSLSGDVITNFEAHLKEVFSDLDPEIFQQMMKFAQGVGPVKDIAYVAHLFEEVTRSHGAGYSTLHGTKFSDPLFVTAFIQAGAYSRGRYGDIIPNNTSPDMILFTEEMAKDLVPKNADGSLNHEKRESSAHLWKMVNQYDIKILWRGEPHFLKDVRKLFGIGRGEIDMYKTIFPFPGEVVVDAYKVELEKRDLLEQHDKAIKLLTDEKDALLVGEDSTDVDRRILEARKNKESSAKKFLEKYGKYGYGSKLEEVGIGRLAKDPTGETGYGLSVSQYDVSFRAMDEMREFFHNPIGKLDRESCLKKWTYWMQSIVGKAKLIPGRHYLMFPYFTMLAALKIVSGYEYRNDAFKVYSLLDELKDQLRQAGGIPSYVKKEVLQYFELDKERFGVFQVLGDAEKYIGDSYRYRTRSAKGIEEKVRAGLPLHVGKINDDGSSMRVSPPWFWDVKANKDTSEK